MNSKYKRIILGASIVGAFSLILGMSLSIGEDIRDFEYIAPYNGEGVCIGEVSNEPGPMFYPATYSGEPSNETYYSNQNSWTFTPMNYKKAVWDTYRGDSVKVAVIDSGLNYTHEDFISGGNQIIEGHSRTIEYASGSWKYYQFDYSSANAAKINDTLGHGTNVASVIASQLNAVGCAGIAPNVELYIYKVTNSNNGYEWTAINNALQYCIDEGMDVVNMSFQAYEHDVEYNGSSMAASSGCSSVLTTKLNACYNAGITLVAAAGNYNTSEPSYPASNNHVISVGSLAKSSTTTKAGYSNTYGVDIVAPGSVYAANIGGNSAYKETQGTSFSSPIVTAAIALYKQKYPTATPDQIEAALKQSADKLTGLPSWAGAGRLNVAKFLEIDPYPTSITLNNVTNNELALTVGDEYQLNWTVNGIGNFDNSVEFEVLGDLVSVDANGLITALSEGGDVLSISSTVDSSIYQMIDITVTNPTPTPTVTEANKYSGNITEGDYVFVYNDIAMTNTISGNRLTNTSVTISDNKISSPDDSIVWHVAPSGDYWTIYNSSVSKYAGSNGSKNQAALLTSVTDNAKWTITGSSTYEFENLGRSKGSDSSNKWLRRNGDYGFGCYATGTGGALSLYKVESTTAKTLSSISISGQTTSFVEGDNFSFGGTVTAHFSDNSTSNVTSSATFTGYNMTNVSQQTVTVSYTYQGTTKTQTYNITIGAGTLSSITLTGQTTAYIQNQEFSFTGTCTANFANGYSKSVTPTSVSSVDTSVLGNHTVTVSYTYNGNTRTANYTITVSVQVVLSKIEFVNLPSTVIYKTDLDLSGTTVKATLSDGTVIADVKSSCTITTIDTSVLGRQAITASYTYEGVTKEVTGYVKVTNVGSSNPTSTETYTLMTSDTKNTLSVNYEKKKEKSETNVTSLAASFRVAVTNIGDYYDTIRFKIYNEDTVIATADEELKLSASEIIFTHTFNFDSPVSITHISYTLVAKTSGSNIKERQFDVTITTGDPNYYDDQAIAWANYFLAQIKPECNISGVGSDLDDIVSKWEDLSNEYTNMLGDSKDAFVSSSDSSIMEAIELYQLIRSKYSSVYYPHLSNFITNGNNDIALAEVVHTYFSPLNSETISIVLIIVISVIAITSIVGYVYISNRRGKNK